MDTPLPPNTTAIDDGVKPLPYSSLLRFEMMANQIDNLKLYEYDYLYYCDLETLAVAAFCEDILRTRVAARHPHYQSLNSSELPYERRPQSTAAVDDNDFIRPVPYYGGGFYGGLARQFISLITVLKYNVQLDIKHHITARANDESHLNKYFLTYSPSLVLPPSYLYLNSQLVLNFPMNKEL